MGEVVTAARAAELRAQREKAAAPLEVVTGAAIFDLPPQPVALVGDGDEVLAAVGEATMLYGPTGLGKTTVAQRIALAAVGIGDEVIGYPVRRLAEGRRVLYLAADRPAQAMRSLRRMVGEGDRERLEESWRFEIKRQVKASDGPTALWHLAEQEQAGLVVLDSLKDLAGGPLSDEKTAAALVDNWQRLIVEGVEVLALHHPRKSSNDNPGKRLELDDVYGSTWLTASCGSVILITGAAGGGYVQIRQLKAPAEFVPEMGAVIDYQSGQVERRNYRDLAEWLRDYGAAVTLRQVAAFKFGKPESDVTDADRKRVARELERLVLRGDVKEHAPGSGKATTYQWLAEVVF